MSSLCDGRSFRSDSPWRVLEICDQALLNAANARKDKDDASDDDIERAIRELEYYGLTYRLS